VDAEGVWNGQGGLDPNEEGRKRGKRTQTFVRRKTWEKSSSSIRQKGKLSHKSKKSITPRPPQSSRGGGEGTHCGVQREGKLVNRDNAP